MTSLPTLHPPRPVEPRQLDKLRAELVRRAGTADGGAGPVAADWACAALATGVIPARLDERDPTVEALSWLASAHGAHTAPPSRRALSSLLRLLSCKSLEEGDRQRILDALLAPDAAVGWRKLWALWEMQPAGRDRARVAVALGERIEARLLERPQFTERLPEWLRLPRAMASQSLVDPVPYMKAWWDLRQVSLPMLHEALGCATDSGPGLDGVLAILRDPARRWLTGDREALRSWAAARGDDMALGLMADAMLCDAAGSAERPSQLNITAEARRVRSWIQTTLRFGPVRAAGPWRHVGDRGREAWRLLRLADEMQKILEAFKHNADDQSRVRYWSRRFDQLTDARLFVSADRIAVCLMVFGETMAVEFGTVGNACYFYRAPAVTLDEIPLAQHLRADWFKATYELRLGSERIGYRDKGSHHSRWEQKFDDLLRRYGLTPHPTPASAPADSSAARPRSGSAPAPKPPAKPIEEAVLRSIVARRAYGATRAQISSDTRLLPHAVLSALAYLTATKAVIMRAFPADERYYPAE